MVEIVMSVSNVLAQNDYKNHCFVYLFILWGAFHM